METASIMEIISSEVRAGASRGERAAAALATAQQVPLEGHDMGPPRIQTSCSSPQQQQRVAGPAVGQTAVGTLHGAWSVTADPIQIEAATVVPERRQNDKLAAA